MGGLNYNTREGDLIDHFEKYGKIVDVVVIKHLLGHNIGRSRGFGFVTFQKLEQTEECFTDGPHVIDGNTIELKRATLKAHSK